MPFILTIEPHRVSWKDDYSSEAARIQTALGSSLTALHHIGSTSIPGITAKPIIDILAEVESVESVDLRAREMEALGYEVMGEFCIPGRRYFRKDDEAGVRTHQVHAFVAGSPDVTRHLAFRDYLRCHPDVAAQYSDLKRRLVDSCNGDFEAYMDGKDAFVKGVERRALEWVAAGRK